METAAGRFAHGRANYCNEETRLEICTGIRHLRAEHGAGAGIPRPGSRLPHADYAGARRTPNTPWTGKPIRTLRARCGRRAASTLCRCPIRLRSGQVRIKYVFRDWEFAGGVASRTNPVTVTASPAIPEYRAIFDVLYGLGVVVLQLPGSRDTARARARSSERSAIQLRRTMCTWRPTPRRFCRRIPNPGYVFVGWQPGANQVIQGFQNTVTMTVPVDRVSADFKWRAR